jgi:hypothetical protein
LKNKLYKVILGGGAYNDLGQGQRVKFENTVLWGGGSSIHGKDSSPTRGDDLPFALYGLRDPDAVSDPKKILPCVSCLHPLLKISQGHETAVFINFDKNITNLEMLTKDEFFAKNNLKIYTNYMNEVQFMKIFSRTRRIITNSYHVSYWSLLSGREVAIIGYSSKFRSLLKLVGLDPNAINHYELNDKTILKSLIKDILKHEKFISLEKFKNVRDEFIDKNVFFAKKCRDIGFIKDFKVRPHDWQTMMKRNIKYNLFQTLVNIRKQQ